jgi:Flp pilus assembly protein TadD
MQNRQQAFNNISREIAIGIQDIKQRQAIQDYSLNIHAENFFRDVFNCVYDCRFENVNFQSINAACIDLLDKHKKLAYQITSTASKEKIINTLQALAKPEYQDYEIRMYYLLAKPKLSGKNKQEIHSDFAVNNIDEHLFDYSDLIKDINNLETDKLIALNHKYFKETNQAQNDTTVKITGSTVHGPVAVAELISNSFNETHHHHYAEKNDITLKHDTVPKRLFSVPFSDENFIGREAELARLDELFNTESKVALTGIGGVGKTRLAVHYAHQQTQRYPFILWVSASTKTILDDGFANLADKLNADPLLKQAEKTAFVKAWLEKNSDWLLIFDSADNMAEMTHDVFQALLPASPLGKILFTTQITTKNFTVNCLPITCLDKQAGARFLWQCIAMDKQPTPEEINDAEAINSQLAGLPLALKQAAAYIETSQCTLPEYLQFYQYYAKELLDPGLDEYKQNIPDHELPVFATFKLSFSRLPTESQDLLAFCAMLYADSIPEEILTTAFELDAFVLNQRLKPIFCYGLLARNSADKILFLHRLVQRVLQVDMDDTQKQARAEQAITALNKLLPCDVDFKHWQLYERLLLSGLACAKWIMDVPISSNNASFLLNQIALYLVNAKADYLQTETLYQSSLAILEKSLGEDHLDVVASLNNLAELYKIQGKYTEAAPLFKRSLAIKEKAVGKNDLDIALSLNNLAELYRIQGKYEQAKLSYRRCIMILEKELGKNHSNVAIPLNNLALLYHAQGFYDKAENLLKRSLAIREKNLDKDHPDVADNLNSLAELYRIKGKYTKAESLCQRSLSIYEKAYGKEHPCVANVLGSLALLYKIQRKFEQAEPLYLQSLAIYKKALGNDHPDIAIPLNNLASLYESQSKYDQAESLYQHSLAIREKALGKSHPNVVTPLNNLAGLYQAQGKYREAEPLYQRGLASAEKSLGNDHPNTQTIRNNLEILQTAIT